MLIVIMSESRLAYSDIQKTDPLVEIQFALQFSKRNGMPLPEKIQYILENNLPIIYLRHISNGGSLLQCDSSLLRVLKILTYFDPRSLP
jgi:hypothetical protein